MVGHTSQRGLGDGAELRALATSGGTAPSGPRPNARQLRLPNWLIRTATLLLGACAAGVLLLVLGSTPAEAAPEAPAEADPSLSDFLEPAQYLVRDGLAPLGNFDVSTGVSLEDPDRAVESLNGAGPLQQGSTRVIGDTVAAAEGVLGATTDAPASLLGVADAVTGARAAAPTGQPSTAAPATEQPLGSGTAPGQVSGREAAANPSDHLDPATAEHVASYVPTAWGTPWSPPESISSAPTTLPATSSPADGAKGQGISLLGPTVKPSSQASASADTTGGNHQLAGTIPMDGSLTPLALFFLASQPRHHRRSPVFPPSVPPG